MLGSSDLKCLPKRRTWSTDGRKERPILPVLVPFQFSGDRRGPVTVEDTENDKKGQDTVGVTSTYPRRDRVERTCRCQTPVRTDATLSGKSVLKKVSRVPDHRRRLLDLRS